MKHTSPIFKIGDLVIRDARLMGEQPEPDQATKDRVRDLTRRIMRDQWSPSEDSPKKKSSS